MRAANDALREAEAVQAKSPKWTRIDETRRMIAQSRGPEYLEKFPLTVVDPSIGAAVIEGHRVQADCQQRLQQATIRQRDCRARVAGVCNAGSTPPCRRSPKNSLFVRILAGELQLRRDRAEGRGPERAQPRLGSKVDEFAYYTRAHGRGTGGGRAFGRGAYGPSMRGRTILPRSNVPCAVSSAHCGSSSGLLAGGDDNEQRPVTFVVEHPMKVTGGWAAVSGAMRAPRGAQKHSTEWSKSRRKLF